MNILLTGYQGFIGQNLYLSLCEQFGEASIIGVEKTDVPAYMADLNKLEDTVKSADAILHNGAIADTSLQDYAEMLYYNYLFSKQLIDFAKKHGKKIIFAGSASIYGNDDYPQNIYAWSKMITEEYGRASYPDGFTSLRYFNVYGPHEEHKGKMASIAYQAFKNQAENGVLFKLFPKKPERDFIYVKDVVNANLVALKTPAGVYDVGTAHPRSFEDMLTHLNIPFEYHHEDKIPSWYQYFTQASQERWLPHWKPVYDLEKGMADYLRYLTRPTL